MWTTVFMCLVAASVLALPQVRAPAIGLNSTQRHKNIGSIDTIIQLAGNANEDEVRLAHLNHLRKQHDLDESLKKDLDKLVLEIDRWINEKSLPYFGREVARTRDFDFGIAGISPLYPLTYLYRGRMLTWYTMESGGIWNIPERKREFLDKACEFFEKAVQAFPENKITQMYLGHPIASEKSYPSFPGAPEWAVYQREGLERLTDIIEWWIDNRMQENGEYGGGWGDDCEMWRWWVPVLIGFDSPKITKAQARFSKALLNQPHMKLGYTTRMSDVEHTAEDSADAITPMMHLDPDNDLWNKHALCLAELMETFWTGRNERGLLQFKSTYFTADKVDASPNRACDTVFHPRVVQPALLYWQRTGDKKLTKLFTSWMDTWVDAAARTDRGKPKGIVPTAIHWPDGGVGGLGPDWWDPRNHSEYTLYLYPSAMSLMTHTLFLTYYMTGQAKYAEPIRSLASIRLKYLEAPGKTQLAPGTEAWCGSRLDLSSVIAKYRFLTGNSEFDRLIAKETLPYMRFRLHGDLSSLVLALRQNAEALRINFPGYTSEVRYTDRVLRFPALFGDNGILAGSLFREHSLRCVATEVATGSTELAPPLEEKRGLAEVKPLITIHTPDTTLLYSTVTGDLGDAGYFPLNAVRWLTPPRDIAAMVTESGTEKFSAELLHFGKNKRQMSAEFYLLRPGDYVLTIRPKDVQGPSTNCIDQTIMKFGTEGTISAGPPEEHPFVGTQTYEFTFKGLRTQVSFQLPPRQLCVLDIHAVRKW